MPLAVTSTRNDLAAAYAAVATHASLHTADPGTTGASEVTGGSPAYARKALTWSAPSGGVITATATFDVPAGATVAFAGLYTGATGTTFKDKATLTSQAFSTQGTYTLTLTFTVS